MTDEQIDPLAYYRSYGVKVAECRGCGATIFLLRHIRTGNQAPIDVEPSVVGTIRIDPVAMCYEIAPPAGEGPERWRHESHFATCPEREKFRREQRQRAPAATPARPDPPPDNILQLPLNRG